MIQQNKNKEGSIKYKKLMHINTGRPHEIQKLVLINSGSLFVFPVTPIALALSPTAILTPMNIEF
jgi:hypothetical protein